MTTINDFTSPESIATLYNAVELTREGQWFEPFALKVNGQIWMASCIGNGHPHDLWITKKGTQGQQGKTFKRVDAMPSNIKEEKSNMVIDEATSIIIDDQFSADMAKGEQLIGKEKSARMASAMKGLLQRNNIVEIKSDFWKVFRILKAKAEKQ